MTEISNSPDVGPRYRITLRTEASGAGRNIDDAVDRVVAAMWEHRDRVRAGERCGSPWRWEPEDVQFAPGQSLSDLTAEECFDIAVDRPSPEEATFDDARRVFAFPIEVNFTVESETAAEAVRLAIDMAVGRVVSGKRPMAALEDSARLVLPIHEKPVLPGTGQVAQRSRPRP